MQPTSYQSFTLQVRAALFPSRPSLVAVDSPCRCNPPCTALHPRICGTPPPRRPRARPPLVPVTLLAPSPLGSRYAWLLSRAPRTPPLPSPSQNWQLGWSSSFVLLTREHLRVGETLLRWIPATSEDPDHMMRVYLLPGPSGQIDRSGVPDTCLKQLWVSYRTAQGKYDALWKEPGLGTALVHMWTDAKFSSQMRPLLVATLAVPNAPTPSDVHVRVRQSREGGRQRLLGRTEEWSYQLM